MMFLTVGASSALGYDRDTWYVSTGGGDRTECDGTTADDWDQIDNDTVTACAFRQIDMIMGTGHGGYNGYSTLAGFDSADKIVIKNGTDYVAGFNDDDATYPDNGKSAAYNYSLKNPPSGLSYNITGITLANPAVVTVDGTHDIDNGQEIWIDFGFTTGGTLNEDFNGKFYTIANKTTSGTFTFELSGIDSSSYMALEGTATAMVPTMIVGEEYDSGCATKPTIYGVARARFIFEVKDDESVYMGCMKLSDKASCISYDCNRSTFPFDNAADFGIRMKNAQNVIVKDVDVIGVSIAGVQVGDRIQDIRFENVKLVGAIGGWDGDLCNGGDYSCTGTGYGVHIHKNFHTWFNGCPTSYPDDIVGDCCEQAATGCGLDGYATTPLDSADLHFLNSSFVLNVSDGLDALYAHTGSIFISRSFFMGNVGNAIKTMNTTYVENSILIGNCHSAHFGQPWQGEYAACRTDGEVFVHDIQDSSATGKDSVLNHVTITSTEAPAFGYIGDGNAASDVCDGTEEIIIRNTIAYGDYRRDQPTNLNDNFYSTNFAAEPGKGQCTNGLWSINFDYSIVDNIDNEPCPSGNLDCDYPQFTTTPDKTNMSYNPTITASSAAVNPATSGTLAFWYGNADFNGNPPIGAKDWGAIELGSVGLTSPYNGYLDYMPAGEIFSFIGDFDFTGSFTLGTQ